MDTPDWDAIERRRDAKLYSDLCNEAEQNAIQKAIEEEEEDRQMNIALTAIRKMHINVSNVCQLLSTIASTAIAQGWTDAQVYPLDIAQTELDE